MSRGQVPRSDAKETGGSSGLMSGEGQADTCENITFLQLRLRTVTRHKIDKDSTDYILTENYQCSVQEHTFCDCERRL